MVAQSMHCLIDMEEATLRALKKGDNIGRGASESMPHLEELLGAWMVVREEV